MISPEKLKQSILALDLREQAHGLIFIGTEKLHESVSADTVLHAISKIWASVEGKIDFCRFIGIFDTSDTPRNLQRRVIRKHREGLSASGKAPSRQRKRGGARTEIKSLLSDQFGLIFLILRSARFHARNGCDLWRAEIAEIYLRACELDAFLIGAGAAYVDRTGPATEARKARGEQRRTEVRRIYESGDFKSKEAAALHIASQMGLSYERARKLLREPKPRRNDDSPSRIDDEAGQIADAP